MDNTAITTVVCKELKISSSHVLPKHPGKCSRLHGHNYRIMVCAKGHLNEQGMVIDFYDLAQAMKLIIEEPCDHRHLNDVYPAIDPTTENLSRIWLLALRVAVPKVFKVQVWETDTCFAESSFVADPPQTARSTSEARHADPFIDSHVNSAAAW